MKRRPIRSECDRMSPERLVIVAKELGISRPRDYTHTRLSAMVRTMIDVRGSRKEMAEILNLADPRTPTDDEVALFILDKAACRVRHPTAYQAA